MQFEVAGQSGKKINSYAPKPLADVLVLSRGPLSHQLVVHCPVAISDHATQLR